MANTSAFPTVRSEGGLLPPDLLTRIVAGDSDLGGLAPADYGLVAKLRLGEATSRAWARARTYWAAFQSARDGLSDKESGVSETREQWLLPLLHELGYGRLEFRAAALEVAGKRYPISHQAGGLPVHVVSFRQDLDRAGPAEAAGRQRVSPHALVQEYLNRADVMYGLVTNGLTLRLLRQNLSLTRLSYVEFDLAAMLEGGVYADFALLYLTLHRTRLPRAGAPAGECWLEKWREKAETQGARALGALKQGVEAAIVALGSGFLAHKDNEQLRRDLKAGTFAVGDYYRELLRLIYRFLFLFVAEERDLLQPPGASAEARRRYREHYGAGRLRDLARRQLADERHDDLWRGLLVTFDLLAGRREGLEVQPLAGGLFGLGSCPRLEQCNIANSALAAAIQHLSFVRLSRRLRRVNYRDIDTEELGGVYESLLERQPHLAVDGAHFELVGSGARKQTGSYYTPSSLVQELVKSALEPVLDDRLRGLKTAAEREKAILGLTVCDSACGSGHFLLAAARRLARELASIRAGDNEPTPVQLRQALRDVIRSSIYGVDLNPLAVDLCQLGLWLEGHAPGLPLSFLDHRVRCGNSLVGATPELLEAGIPDGAYDAVEGDDKKLAAAYKKRNRQEREGQQQLPIDDWKRHGPTLARYFAELGLLPEGTAAEVEAKRRQWEQLRGKQDWWRDLTVAHLWTAAFYAPLTKADDPTVPTTGALRTASRPGESHGGLVGKAHELSVQHRFFHWHLEFPEVGARGGFDCVLGNPPWERIKLQEEEFFAERDREIADAPNKAARQKLIDALAQANPDLARAFAAAKRAAESQSKFVRASERFPLCAVGDVNLYALFAEEDRTLANPRGRCGVLVPTGIATDDSTKAFFGDLAEKGALATLFDFENRDAIFPGVHRSYKFCLLTVAGGRVPQGDFAFFLHHTDELHDERRRFGLSPEDFALLNPNTRTCPVFRTKADAELTRAIYRRVPVLVNERTGENPWGVSFLRMFDMSNDSGLFRTAEQLARGGWRPVGNAWQRGGERYLPLYEAKMFHHYNHRWATYQSGDFRDATPGELANPSFSAIPRYWVERKEVEARVGGRGGNTWLLTFRGVARATDERTGIVAVIPIAGLGNSAPVFISHRAKGRLAAALVGCLASLIFDFSARPKVGGININFFIVNQFAAMAPSAYSETDLDFTTPRVLELTYTAHDLQPFARDLGYHGPPFRWDEERRALLRAELDAYYAALYGLSRDELRYILDPADVFGPEFPGETFRVLKEKESKKYGEYRTRRLVLEAWDRLGLAPRNRDGRYSVEPSAPPAGGQPSPPRPSPAPGANPTWATPRPTLPGMEPLQRRFRDMVIKED